MILCPDCGCQASDGSYFCPDCGRRLQELPPDVARFVAPEDVRRVPMPVLVQEHPADAGVPPARPGPIPLSELPGQFRGLEAQYGEIYAAEFICPGVYYIATRPSGADSFFGGEYLVVSEDSSAMSPEALSYGVPLPTIPRSFLYDYDYSCKGRHVVEYEAHKYLDEHGLPLPEGASLAADRAFGMDACPEYFGAFPAPEETPWGPALRHERLCNGLFWLETAQAGWVLAIAYPLCSELFEETLDRAALTEHDRAQGIHNTCGYRFYSYQTSCLPLYEMLPFAEDTWGTRIDPAALKNAILKYFPDYGSGDGFSGLQMMEGERLQETPGAGTDFYRFP